MKLDANPSSYLPTGEEVWLLFDGDCALCNSLVNFVLENERDEVIKFIALESELGKKLMKYHLPEWNSAESFVLLTAQACYTESDACAELATHLKPPYSLLEGIKFTPSFLRNRIYQLVAKTRYRWNSKGLKCSLNHKDKSHRFLDSF